MTSKERKEVSKKKRVLLISVFATITSILGVAGGAFLAIQFTPGADMIKGIGKVNYDEIRKALYDNNGNLKENVNVINAFQNNAYDLVNIAAYNHAMSPYSLSVGYSIVDAGVAKQEITCSTYVTPKEIFNQNVSSSSFVKTAFRFYDKLDGNSIEAYEKQTPSQWVDGLTPTKKYSYDEYIQTYGKLLKGLYWVGENPDSGANINETYLDNGDPKDEGHSLIQSPVIYDLTNISVLNSTIETSGQYYKVKIDLNIQNGVGPGISHYQVQMIKNGGLKEPPQFMSSHLEFLIDKKINLVSARFIDDYTVKVVGNNRSKGDMQVHYFQSKTSTFTSTMDSLKQLEIKVPSIGEEFNGFEFFDPKGAYIK